MGLDIYDGEGRTGDWWEDIRVGSNFRSLYDTFIIIWLFGMIVSCGDKDQKIISVIKEVTNMINPFISFLIFFVLSFIFFKLFWTIMTYIRPRKTWLSLVFFERILFFCSLPCCVVSMFILYKVMNFE
ncbi:unnamed protein product, partial [marine sediment metagenome]